jgi:hypothetical protein
VGCTTDACNEGTDSCDNTPDDAACDDGLFCNGAETCDAVLDCQAGIAVDCDDGVGCTTDACNEGTDSCDNTPDDAVCDDGLFCNGSETCDAVLDCQAGTAVDCDDGVGCTTDSCNEGTDSCDNTPDDAACDDGLFCNGTETCDAVLDCQAGTAVDCDDGVGCTTDACNEGTDSCDNTPDDAACDDGLFCNGAETCDAVLDCQAGTVVDCDDAEICTDDSCNETTDQCDNIYDQGNDPSCVDPVDLDIVKFKVKDKMRLKNKPKSLQLKLTVINPGTVFGTANARIVGVQNSSTVYDETIPVTTSAKTHKLKIIFPLYTPTATGDIVWTVTIADGDPDVDQATATTRVLGP